ncbi:MAG: DUF167 family protein [Candidatus Aenigmatarchaeota archaeon]
MIIRAKVKTGCKNQYIKTLEDIIGIGLEALPEKRKANIEVIKILANYYGIPATNIKLIKGIKSIVFQ